jgi:hypothetical protein
MLSIILGYDYDNAAYDHSYDDLDGQTTIGSREQILALTRE